MATFKEQLTNDYTSTRIKIHTEALVRELYKQQLLEERHCNDIQKSLEEATTSDMIDFLSDVRMAWELYIGKQGKK